MPRKPARPCCRLDDGDAVACDAGTVTDTGLAKGSHTFTVVAIGGAPLIVPAGTGVLANDTDADSDPLTAHLDSQPAGGAVTLNADGSFAYTAPAATTSSSPSAATTSSTADPKTTSCAAPPATTASRPAVITVSVP